MATKKGRPALRPARRRSFILHVRLSPAEVTAVAQHAEAERLPVSECVRRILRNAGVTP